MRRKLVALLVAASIVPLGVAAVLDVNAARTRLRESAAALLAAHADQLRSQLDAFNGAYMLSATKLSRLSALRDVARTRGADPAVVEKARDLLDIHLQSDDRLAAVAVLDGAGKVLVSVVNPAVAGEPSPLDGKSLSRRAYVREALMLDRALRPDDDLDARLLPGPVPVPVISDVQAPEAEMKPDPVIAYAAPFEEAPAAVSQTQAPPIGLVVLWGRAEELSVIARGANDLAGPGSFVVLADSDGIRIAHTSDETMVFHPTAPLDPARLAALIDEQRFGPRTKELLEDVRPFPEVSRRARALEPSLSMFRGIASVNQQWNYGVARRLVQTPWTLIYLLPVRTLDGQLATQTRDKLILAGLIIALAFALGLALATAILRPVVSLAAATSQISAGDLSARVPIDRDDEIGQLCASFNAMAERIEHDDAALRESRDELEDRVAERTGELVRSVITGERAREALEASKARLEILSRTAHELAAASDDVETVLELAVRRIGEAIGEVCTLRLLSEDGAWLEPTRAVFHPDPDRGAAAARLLGSTRVAVGEGMGGRVAATGEAMLVPEVSIDQVLAMIPPAFHAVAREAGLSSLLAVPLRSRERTIGVVILLRSKPGNPYTIDDQRFAQDVADRAGLAIDNAVLVDSLERRVVARTAALETANHELEAFSYSVSHDLRAPLRAIDGFSSILLADHAGQLDDEGQRALQRIRVATQRMTALIDDLLNLARITRTQLRWTPIDLTSLAGQVAAELARRDPARTTQVHVALGLVSRGDARLITIVLDNLIGNAWKFTAKRAGAEIWIGSEQRDGRTVFFVRDTGAGFDMKYVDKLFLPFQRLHSPDEFEGVGVGLATVHRIISHHGGRIWAEAAVGAGATFLFYLGEPA